MSIQQANQVFRENFPLESGFERAVFFSWGCSIGDCGFCYMSIQPDGKKPRETKRSSASILAEFLLSKKLRWDIGFFTGGIGVFTPDELEVMLKQIHEIIGEKIWLSVGPVSKPVLQKYLPYVKGVVGSTETINPVLHKKVCPSKPLGPYERMFDAAKELGLKRAMTFIVGMGEQREDLELLKTFIIKHDIDKIHVYGLIPVEGTMFESMRAPTAEEQAWWIAQLRIAFPKLDIQCGIWEDRMERVSLLLEAGANSISKFQALKLFGTKVCYELEEQVRMTGRTFKGSVTKVPDIDWDAEVEKLNFEQKLKNEIKLKLQIYLRKIQSNIRQTAKVQVQQ